VAEINWPERPDEPTDEKIDKGMDSILKFFTLYLRESKSGRRELLVELRENGNPDDRKGTLDRVQTYLAVIAITTEELMGSLEEVFKEDLCKGPP